MFPFSLKKNSFQISSFILVMRSIEEDMEVIGVTGVEDQLQPEVRTTLERLHHAGVKVWMLTGDKVTEEETRREAKKKERKKEETRRGAKKKERRRKKGGGERRRKKEGRKEGE